MVTMWYWPTLGLDAFVDIEFVSPVETILTET